MDYSSLPRDGKRQFDAGADFAAVRLKTTFIVVNSANFWQSSYSEMLGSLLHEMIHLSNDNNYSLFDTDIQRLLILDQNAKNTTNISRKLATDCFQ